jgi:hypothetical protein
MVSTSLQRTDASFGASLRSIFAIIARRPRTCAAIGAAYAAAIGLANAVARSATGVLDPTTVSPGEVVAAGVAALVALGILLLVNMIVLPVTLGALSLVGSAGVYGDDVETEGTLRRALDRAFEAIGAFVLVFLCLVAQLAAVGIIALIVALVASPDIGFGVLNVASIILLIPVTYVIVRFSLAVPVVMREGRGPIDAMRRSWTLVGGMWWWVFGLLLPGLIVFALNAAFSLRSFVGPDLIGDFLLGSAISGIAAMVSVVLYAIGSGVAYARLAPEDAVSPDVAASEARADESPLPETPAEPAAGPLNTGPQSSADPPSPPPGL